MANTKLIRTPSSASNQKTFTISVWFKIGRHPYTDGGNGTSREIIGQTSSGHFRFMIKSDRKIRFYGNNAAGQAFDLSCNRIFSDHSAFYHAVLRVDMTQGTREDRIRLYINGVDERTVGGYATDTIPAQGTNLSWNTATVHQVGGHSGNYDYFSGVMSHIHHCDGASLAPTVFGSTDSTTGEWKINTSPTFTPGTNGFTILKDGNTITDQSSNSNNFSLQSGTLTKTEDNPSNVFATLNPLWTQESTRVPTLTLGNNMFSGGSSSTWYQTIGTLGFSSGKYYWEAKYNAGTNLGKNLIGAIGIDGVSSGVFYQKTPSVFYKNEDGGETRVNNSQSSGNYGTLAQNDILGCAIDMDASTPTATFYKNGSALVSNVSLTGFAGKTIVPAVSTYSSGEFQMNFGNGYFGTTAVSSAGTNASGNGIFEYNVPANHTALSTKGLNL